MAPQIIFSKNESTTVVFCYSYFQRTGLQLECSDIKEFRDGRAYFKYSDMLFSCAVTKAGKVKNVSTQKVESLHD